jgi:hypothetical protein
MRDYSLYLSDILRAFEAIENFVQGQSFEDFKQDDKTSSAVIRKFEIIGEAAKQVPEHIKQEYPFCSLEGNGRNERHAHTPLLRCKLSNPLADYKEQNPQYQTRNSQNSQGFYQIDEQLKANVF